MKKAGFNDAACPIARSVSAIGDVWSLLIIRDAIVGVRRFGEFQKRLGLAKNILAGRLKKLVACGILELAPASDGSAYQEYVPTQRGLDLLTVVVALGQWGDRWLVAPGETCMTLREAATGQRLAELQVRGQDGRRLTQRDLAAASDVHPAAFTAAMTPPAPVSPQSTDDRRSGLSRAAGPRRAKSAASQPAAAG